jgi:hypothetical protein
MELLTEEESVHFLKKGFVYVRQAFAAQDAEQMCDFLWTQITSDRHDRDTWTQAVYHIEEVFAHGPFGRVFTPRLCAAINDVVGKGRYQLFDGIGWFAISFPGLDSWLSPPDKWWHLDIDTSGKINVDLRQANVRRQVLIVIPVLSAIKPGGGGTLLAAGTHKVVARALGKAEPEGLDRDALNRIARRERSEVVEVNGEPGDAVLVHDWLLHAPGPNNGDCVRFTANPAVSVVEPLDLRGGDLLQESLFEQSIRLALESGAEHTIHEH